VLYQFPALVSFGFSFENRLQAPQAVPGQKSRRFEICRCLLHPNFIKTFRVLNMFEIGFWNFINFFDKVKRPDDFFFHLVTLLYKKVFEVLIVKNNVSALLLF
jgi:hypothetical protein